MRSSSLDHAYRWTTGLKRTPSWETAGRYVAAMARHVQLRELLVGVEGLALLRHLYDGTDADADQRLREVRRLLEDDDLSAGELMIEARPRNGYRAWSDSYDEPGNPIIALEEPVVWSLLNDLRPGRALDIACGTGRHTAHLVGRGHAVVGVDYTPEMLQRAQARTAGAAFLEGDLRMLPLKDAAFDLVVCGLALAHLPNLDAAVAEVARVLAPGGRVVISVLHPLQAYLGWHAPFEEQDGQRGFVREHPHTHGDYFDAFQRAGLSWRGCIEPLLGPAEVESKRRAFRHIPDAAMAAYEGLPGVLIIDAERRT
jgi:SAM-dependent methyltransferase